MNLSESYRRRLQELAAIQKSPTLLIIQKGHNLFHGTGEPFDSKEIRPGGYDKVFWTTEYPAISQSYIPVAGTSMYTSSSALSKPSTRKDIIEYQKQLGIEYSEVEGNIHVESYREAHVFKEQSDKQHELWQNYFKLSQELDALKKQIRANWQNLSSDEKIEVSNKELDLEESVINAQDEWRKHDLDKIKNEYVNNKLEKEFGYEPSERNSYKSDHGWKLKLGYKDGKSFILPADYRLQGRLLIITPKEDLKIYDYTLGGQREPDLTDLDYHKHNVFKMAEEEGYDGIKITDFAQIDDMGNFGHESIGLFKNALKKVDVKEISAVHPKDFEQKHFFKRDYETDEYKSYKSGLALESTKKSNKLILKESIRKQITKLFEMERIHNLVGVVEGMPEDANLTVDQEISIGLLAEWIANNSHKQLYYYYKRDNNYIFHCGNPEFKAELFGVDPEGNIIWLQNNSAIESEEQFEIIWEMRYYAD